MYGILGSQFFKTTTLEYSREFLTNSLALSDQEDITLGPLNRGSIVDLPLLRSLLTIHYSLKVTKVKFLGSDTLFCLISINNFSCFQNPFVTITNLYELHFRRRRFAL